MPLFGSGSGDTTTWEPQAADSRLAHTAGAAPGGVFTSDLSVSEYVLLGEAGFEPLGFVVGSSIYHIGIQVGRWSQNAELQVLTQAMYSARELAMSRMRAEADHLGADGVVGVSLRMQMYVWGQDVLEFVATGTAVKALGARARTGPRTAARSPRTCPPRTSSGCWPQGPSRWRSCWAPASTTSRTSRSSRRCASPGGTRRWSSSPRASTRRASWPRMQAEASDARASGIVGVNVAVSNHVWGEHATEFLATGTAIRRLGDEHRLPATTPKPTFTLGLDS
ncbi:MAG TPA: heavy metal-binding domain-containing protein [Streptosporangiaceae bacterium]